MRKENLVWAALLLGAFTLPIFRSGRRDDLTLVGFIVNHTIFGPEVEYVPREDYRTELSRRLWIATD